MGMGTVSGQIFVAVSKVMLGSSASQLAQRVLGARTVIGHVSVVPMDHVTQSMAAASVILVTLATIVLHHVREHLVHTAYISVAVKTMLHVTMWMDDAHVHQAIMVYIAIKSAPQEPQEKTVNNWNVSVKMVEHVMKIESAYVLMDIRGSPVV